MENMLLSDQITDVFTKKTFAYSRKKLMEW